MHISFFFKCLFLLHLKVNLSKCILRQNEQDLGQTDWCWYQHCHSCRGQLVQTKFLPAKSLEIFQTIFLQTQFLCKLFWKYFRQFWMEILVRHIIMVNLQFSLQLQEMSFSQEIQLFTNLNLKKTPSVSC